MPARSLCHSLFENLNGPQMRVASLAARGLFVSLIGCLRQLGLASLRFGSRVPTTTEVARMLSCAETELETYLAELFDLGVLVREADGAISCPALTAAFAAAQARRNNGLRGGRPRRGETAAEALRRRQGHLALPLTGGAAKPNPEDDKLKLKPESQDKPELEALVLEAEEAAGCGAEFRGRNLTMLRQWREAGANQALILAVIAERLPAARERVRGLSYFDQAVREALAAAPGAEDDEYDFAAHQRALLAWHEHGHVGPVPDIHDFPRRRAA